MEKPWLNEPDYEEFMYREIECVIMRIPRLGCLSGSIGIEEGREYYRSEYSLLRFEVHGGMTYSGTSLPNGTKSGKWWIGFDTMHDGDLIPRMVDSTPGYPNLFFVNSNIVYRDISFVREQLKKLVDQVLD